MPLRPPAGFISANYDPLRNPDAPTGVTASAGDAQASVSFTAPANVGGSAISAYYAVSNPGQITASGASSPVTVTGLTNGTAYTFQVWALNTFGPGAFSAASGSVTPFTPSRGVFAGGAGGGNVIQYITIETTGNATDFGDLSSTPAEFSAGCGSTTRGLIGRGISFNIQYITFATTGNSTLFGNLSVDRYGMASCNSSTRGIFSGGQTSTSTGSQSNVIDYVAIATTGNATDFGDLTVARGLFSGSSSSTRGVFSGGRTIGVITYYNVIDYITIASTGNATDFGDLSLAVAGTGSASNATRSLIAFGGNAVDNYNTVEYITIATTGNTTDFGDLAYPGIGVAGVSNSTRAVFAGNPSGANMNYFIIATTGNYTTFGNLLTTSYWMGSCSSANGGTQ